MTVSDNMSKLTRVSVLDMSVNDIATIPFAVFSVTTLTNLNVRAISCCFFLFCAHMPSQLSENAIVELPSLVSGLVFLKKLDVSHNRLRSLPAQLGLLTGLELLGVTHVIRRADLSH